MCVEVSCERSLPYIGVEGWKPERFAHAVHVGREAEFVEATGDPVDVIGHDLGTRAPWEVVALTRWWRFAAVIRLIKLGPEQGVLDQVFDTFEMFGKIRVVCQFVVFVKRGESD